jgi:hypothetical protein
MPMAFMTTCLLTRQTWEERLLEGRINPNEKAYDIVTGHDTLFYASGVGKFYMSIDDGLNWQVIGNRLPSAATNVVNAKEALIMSRYIFDGGSKILFYYLKKDALQILCKFQCCIQSFHLQN